MILKKKIQDKIESYIIVITDELEAATDAKNQGLPLIVYETTDNKEELFPKCECVIQDMEVLEDEGFLLRMCQRHYNKPWVIAETDRLTIREISYADFDLIPRELYIEETREEEIIRLSSYINNMYGFYGFGIWLLIKNDTGEIIGTAGLGLRDEGGVPDLGYHIIEKYQRQGYGYEASCAILEYSFKELFLNTVCCFISEDNWRSRGLFNKLKQKYGDKLCLKG